VKRKSKNDVEYFVQRNINDYFVDLSLSSVGRLTVSSSSSKFTRQMVRELLAELKSKPGRKDSAYR
jgi:hypothetical protein